MNDITSFKVDHTILEPGIYLRDLKNNIKSWDIRFKKPNSGDYMSPATIHTLEHLLATYYKNVLSDVTYSVCPMGCQTGFYILTEDIVSERTMYLSMLGAHSYIMSTTEIPGASVESCGQYDLQDLDGAKKVMEEFHENVLSKFELDFYMDMIDKELKEPVIFEGEVYNDL